MKRLLLSLAIVLAAGPALANHCPKDMAAIDAKLATSPKLSEADMTKVKALRSEYQSDIDLQKLASELGLNESCLFIGRCASVPDLLAASYQMKPWV